MKFKEKYLNNGWPIFLCGLLISLGLFLPDTKLQLDFKLLLFILSGLCSGIFYGLNNHVIFHHPYDKKYYNDNASTFKALGVFPGIPELNNVAPIHIFWVHVISGIIASISLYLLSTRVQSIESIIDSDKVVLNLILLFISVLGYVGYLPRTLWFFATKGGLVVDRPS